jgi:hypothetical protein
MMGARTLRAELREGEARTATVARLPGPRVDLQARCVGWDRGHRVLHTQGKGIAGTYTFEVAEQKKFEVLLMAKVEEPLGSVLSIVEYRSVGAGGAFTRDISVPTPIDRSPAA